MTLDSIQYWFLAIIDAGCIFRIVFLFIVLMGKGTDDSLGIVSLKNRIKNIVLFLIIANSLIGFKSYFMSKFGG